MGPLRALWGGPILLYAQHGRWLESARLLRRLIAPTVSGKQGRHREVGSEGSWKQTCDLRNTNRIGGRFRRASWHKTTKPDAIKGGGGKCGKGAGTVNVLIWGDLSPGGLRPQPSSRGEAEAAGVSRGHSTDRSQFVSGRAERQMCSEWNVRGMSEEGRLPQIEVLLVERSR